MARKLDSINGEAPGGGVKAISDGEAEAAFRTILQWIGEDPGPRRPARDAAPAGAGLPRVFLRL